MSQNNNSSSSSVAITINPASSVKPNEADGSMPAVEAGTLLVTMGMFFDGTGNNKFNVDNIDPLYDDDSYSSSYSNVARAWEYYKGVLNGTDIENFNIYVDGIGTTADERDSTLGFGLGIGETGIKDRVKLGTFQSVKALYNADNVDKYKIKTIEITFDVFGFSRGAAAARHFVDLNSRPYKMPNRAIPPRPISPGETYAAPILNFDNYFDFICNTLASKNSLNKISVKINWRFLGLYETVSSHGLNRSDDIGELGLMNINNVKNIFHIVASDEYREKFSITPIQNPIIKDGKLTSKSSGGSGKDSDGNPITTYKETYVMPGVHSDIGGGYADSLDETNMQIFKSSNEAKVKKVKTFISDQGWFKENDGSNIDKLQIERGSGQSGRIKKLIASRKNISNIYSYIPLHLMTEKAIAAGVDFNEQALKGAYSTSSDNFLSSIYNKIKTNPERLTSDELETLRYEYLHWSARYGEKAGAHDPRFNDNDKTKYEREIIPIGRYL